MTTETHPFEPFLPSNAKILLLGTFPAKPVRWSMDFYYPNFINDMWRVMGLLFFEDKDCFVLKDSPKGRFDKQRIMDFCSLKGLALSDTAREIERLKDNASDQFLNIVKTTDISEYLRVLPFCKAVVTTGTKAAEVLCREYGCALPPVGGPQRISVAGKQYDFYRMPSTSRAYPLSFEKKADIYRKMFSSEGML
ncbi:MAG: uracil-DNA glycosylase family protein [Bacteroidales bacterium]